MYELRTDLDLGLVIMLQWDRFASLLLCLAKRNKAQATGLTEIVPPKQHYHLEGSGDFQATKDYICTG